MPVQNGRQAACEARWERVASVIPLAFDGHDEAVTAGSSVSPVNAPGKRSKLNRARRFRLGVGPGQERLLRGDPAGQHRPVPLPDRWLITGHSESQSETARPVDFAKPRKMAPARGRRRARLESGAADLAGICTYLQVQGGRRRRETDRKHRGGRSQLPAGAGKWVAGSGRQPADQAGAADNAAAKPCQSTSGSSKPTERRIRWRETPQASAHSSSV